MARLEDLPVELLHSILVFSHSPSLSLLNHYFHDLFKAAPNAIRADYLLNSWHESYGYYDLGLAESRFVPVLIQPKEEAQRCSIFVLDYCVRFPICNHLVLRLLEQRLLTEEMWGNINASVDILRQPLESGNAREEEAPAAHRASSAFFPIQQLPKRLFKNLKKASTTIPSSQDPQLLLDEASASKLSELLALFGPTDQFPPVEDLLLVLRIILVHHPLRSFMTYTSHAKLESSPCLIDSHDGHPLSKAVVLQAASLVAFLLAFGANPTAKESLPLLIACRANWEHGVRMMVERDEETTQVWEEAVRDLRTWFTNVDQGRGHDAEKEVEPTTPIASTSANDDVSGSADAKRNGDASAPGSSTSAEAAPAKRRRSAKSKRRKLEDRAPVTPRMLREAVQHNCMDVAQYLLNEKGVAPCIKTMEILEEKDAERAKREAKGKAPAEGSRRRRDRGSSTPTPGSSSSAKRQRR